MAKKTNHKSRARVPQPFARLVQLPIAILGDMQIDSVIADEIRNPTGTVERLDWKAEEQRHIFSIRRPGGIWLLEDVLREGVGFKHVQAFPPSQEPAEPTLYNKYDCDYCPESLIKLRASNKMI
jgi:hypothetical protein